MGLETREEGNYITILGGRFCIRVPEGTEGAVTRVNKIGNTVHEKFYNSFTGKLVGIQVKDGGDYGPSWNFSFVDGGETYILQLSYSNSFATAFLKMLPNIDLSKEMKLSPSVKEVDGKNKSSLFVNQDGQAIKHAYTMAEPNGLPEMIQIVVKGEKVWDDTDRLVFLRNMVDTTIIPKLTVLTAGTNPAEKEVSVGTPVDPAPAVSTTGGLGTPEVQVTTEDINPEDIPF